MQKRVKNSNLIIGIFRLKEEVHIFGLYIYLFDLDCESCGPWGLWSICNNDCGPGRRIRNRQCPDLRCPTRTDLEPCTGTSGCNRKFYNNESSQQKFLIQWIPS